MHLGNRSSSTGGSGSSSGIIAIILAFCHELGRRSAASNWPLISTSTNTSTIITRRTERCCFTCELAARFWVLHVNIIFTTIMATVACSTTTTTTRGGSSGGWRG